MPSLHISPIYVARASRRRRAGAHGLEDGEGVVNATLSRPEGVRSGTASVSTSAVGNR